jgi:hypothetical protein
MSAVTAPPEAWTSTYCPGATSPESVVTDPNAPVPVALAYCSDLPASDAVAVPRLKSST